MNMNTIQSEFERLGITEKSQEVKKTKDNLHPKKKKYSSREIEELMGKRRPIYQRRNGAIRQK